MEFVRAACLLVVISLTACVSLDSEQMGAIDGVGLSRHSQVIDLAVSSRIDQSDRVEGGEVFLAKLSPSAKAIEAAVRTAIDRTGFLAGIDGSATWKLNVVLRRAALVEATTSRWDREAMVICDWSLTELGASEALWSQRVKTSDRKTMAEVFAGDKRTAMALEGAVRANIAEAFRTLEDSGALTGGSQ